MVYNLFYTVTLGINNVSKCEFILLVVKLTHLNNDKNTYFNRSDIIQLDHKKRLHIVNQI